MCSILRRQKKREDDTVLARLKYTFEPPENSFNAHLRVSGEDDFATFSLNDGDSSVFLKLTQNEMADFATMMLRGAQVAREASKTE